MNKTLVSILVGALVLVGLGGYFAGKSSGQQLGASTVTYYSSLGNTALRTVLDGLVTDIASLHAPLAGVIATTTAAIGVPTLGPVGASTSTFTQNVTVTGAALGDNVIVGGRSTSSKGIAVVGQVLSANTVELYWYTVSSTIAVLPATSTYNLVILPFGSFVRPNATTTGSIATSSSQ